jgi:hypothetical protein
MEGNPVGKFFDAQYDHLESINRRIEVTSSPHHRAILANYQEHVALEQAGRWPEIFERDLIVEHPVYMTNLTGSLTTLDGADAVGVFYDGIGDEVFAMVNERLAVDDWGLASYSDIFEFVTGETALARGYEVADPGLWYMLYVPQTMFWLYDENAKLKGEHLYWVGKQELRDADQDDVLTKARIVESCEQFIPTGATR